jgi:hypothetical protein
MISYFRIIAGRNIPARSAAIIAENPPAMVPPCRLNTRRTMLCISSTRIKSQRIYICQGVKSKRGSVFEHTRHS